ncbi:hypothetical protein Q8W15_19375 [Photobacterium damselae subsp. piscicida]|nr:hypothetical protein [Photobacterium damselae subsp. piscicida]MDP2558855.1 hypothetical protein [Photobacterium damselae subsp. piscicida]
MIKIRSFQGNAKSVALVNGKPVAVGYSTDDVRNDYYANRAAVFTPKSDMDINNPKADDWSIKLSLELKSMMVVIVTYPTQWLQRLTLMVK